MGFIADMLLLAGTFAAAFYCRTLAVKMSKFKNLDQGLGAAIATLSAQVDSMKAALTSTRQFSGDAVNNLQEMTARAEIAAGRLEILTANVLENKRANKQNDATNLAGGTMAYRLPLKLRPQDRLGPPDPTESDREIEAQAKAPSAEASDVDQLLATLKQTLLARGLASAAK